MSYPTRSFMKSVGFQAIFMSALLLFSGCESSSVIEADETAAAEVPQVEETLWNVIAIEPGHTGLQLHPMLLGDTRNTQQTIHGI